MNTNSSGWIATLAQHRLAANLLMVILLLAGVWGAMKLHVQMNPNQSWNQAEIQVIWPGASAEDVEILVTNPIEYQMRGIQGLSNLRSWTRNGVAYINLRFDRNTDMSAAVDEVKQLLGQVRGLPPEIEPPTVQINRWYETVASIFITGPESIEELAPYAQEIEKDLRRAGIDVVELRGMPQEEIAIEIDGVTLVEMNASLADIARSVSSLSSDIPAGTIGIGQGERQIRSMDQQRTVEGFEQMPIASTRGDQLVQLGDIASVERRQIDNQRLKLIDGKPAIEIRLRRGDGMDTFNAADILKQWRAGNESRLNAQGIEVQVFLEAWKFAKDTLSLVFWNGVSGLILVLAMLFLFLNLRVAFWVAVGIPVSFAGALLLFHSVGGSINMLSMIGLVMALGIVVDDAIVVGEHSLYQFEQGKSPEEAAITGARRMLGPITASSLTTLAAFIPLIVVDSDQIVEIPILMLCVIIVSLIECFLIMPGHLKHSFRKMEKDTKTHPFRDAFDKRFNAFRENWVIPTIKSVLRQRRIAILGAFFAFICAAGLVAFNHVKFDLNMNINFEFAEANIQFTPDASDAQRMAYLALLEDKMDATNQHFGGNNIVAGWSELNGAQIGNDYQRGPSFANFQVELTSPETREVTLAEFLKHWQESIPPVTYVEQLQIEQGDQPWPEIEVTFSGGDTATLKQAADEISAVMATIPGVNNIHDDLPYGRDQWVFSLTPEGRAIGLTASQVGSQVRAAFEGYRVQLFTEGDNELEVRVSLPRDERRRLSSLSKLPIVAANGEILPLATVASISSRRGIDRINHVDGVQTVSIRAYPDKSITTSDAVINELEAGPLQEIAQKYGIQSGKGFWAGSQTRLLQEMQIGFLITLILIFIILAWILQSASWPLAIMAAIPFGLTGAFFGLFVMGFNITPMAFLGIFTLTGVIVNDSIILVTSYKEHREAGLCADDALVEAVRNRLRPVILTSLTTGLGLVPMMMETSLMGEAFIPLATVICFGMLYGTVLILLVIPAMLSALDTIQTNWTIYRNRVKEIKRLDREGAQA
ncbi:efflux RND transporter permease subunit [Umboniibacter marinipuniceus]|uniref:Multidrug efflux pump subunit AcrB n=1 Tax=Umboniibacter marinipuniceus TaxID=569599 RepID=A0A3M0A2H9_9GAMM|nr:efflux RND transporter permease subunit [Umboniibacter marinipuniceus]RMA77669.1 multidrug efflux pump subunit AcrB [Umboniibacter marinipuniceus]